MNASPLIFCAIDTPDMDTAKTLAGAMQDVGCGIKLGLEFFNANGPQGIAALCNAYPDLALFLDLKCHDIPNTVAGAMRSLVTLRPSYITLHASGGTEMMHAARDATRDESARLGLAPPSLLAVTVLTSLDNAMLRHIGQHEPAAEQALRLARLAHAAGLPGSVCAGPDILPLRQDLGPDFILMVPGIRPAGTDASDQKRVMTPKDALTAGATHLVIGRPITAAPDPAQAARDILAAII